MLDLLDDICASLTDAGIYATAKVPGQVNPPMAVVVPGVPFITENDGEGNFAEHDTVRFEAVLFARSTDFEEVFDLIEKACIALATYDVQVEGAGDDEFGGRTFMTAVLTITTRTNIGGTN